MCRVHACLAVTCHLHFRQNDRDLLRATAVTRGATDTEIRLSTEEADPGEDHSPAAPAKTQTRHLFDHESGAVTTKLFPPQLTSVQDKPKCLGKLFALFLPLVGVVAEW